LPHWRREAGAYVPRSARQRRASEKSRDTRVLDPAATHVRLNAHGELEIELPDGTVHADARVVPAFPISRPNQFVHVEDAEANELGVLLEPRRLDRESRDLVLAQADEAYFMPRISRIVRVDERMGIARWEVETDRGWSSFDVVSRSESVWYVGRDRLVIRDADGNRYLIEDLSKLDRRSRRLADLFL
jgi:hypothetical protein